MSSRGLAVEQFPLFHRAVHGSPGAPSLQVLSRRIVCGDDQLHGPCLIAPRDRLGCIDAATFAIAVLRTAAPRRVIAVHPAPPTVDTTWDRARLLQRTLRSPSSPIVADVSGALRKIAGEHVEAQPDSLLVARGWPRLRGGSIWCRSPNQPTVLCTDAAQFSTDLLFRSRGAAATDWPLFAGLAGCDSLVMTFDLPVEHPLREVLRVVTRAQAQLERTAGLNPLRWIDVITHMDRVISHEHDATSGLHASPTESGIPAPTSTIHSTSPGAETVAITAHALIRSILPSVSTRLLVVLPDDQTISAVARLVSTELLPGLEMLIAADSMRELERTRLESRLLGDPSRPAGASRQILLCTPAICRSAGLRFDDLIAFVDTTQLSRQLEFFIASVDRPAGRLFTILPSGTSARASDLPNRPREALAPLTGLPLDALEAFELREAGELAYVASLLDQGGRSSPRPSHRHSAQPPSPAPSRPASSLLPAHLSMLARTSPPISLAPDVACFTGFDGTVDQCCAICWRIDLPSVLAGQATLLDYVNAVPPTPGECIAATLVAVRDWLSSTEADSRSRQDGDGALKPIAHRPRVARIASVDRSVTWLSSLSDIADGDVLLISEHPRRQSRVHLSGRLPNPVGTAARSMIDCADEAWRQDGGSIRFRITSTVLDAYSQQARTSTTFTADSMPLDSDLVLPELASALRSLLRPQSRRRIDDSELALLEEVLEAIDTGVSFRFVRHPCGGFVIYSIPIADRWWLDIPDEQTPGLGSLDEHTTDVVTRTERFTSLLRLSPQVSGSLANAARWHDSGKSDHRYQSWIRGGFESAPALARPSHAKAPSVAEMHRCLAGWPRLGRHELLSLEAAHDACSRLDGGGTGFDGALATHLVATHHGHGRPFLHPIDGDFGDGVANELPGTVDSNGVQAQFHASSGGRFEMLNARYGWWGLALLESILRLADARSVEVDCRSMEQHSCAASPDQAAPR